MATTYNHAQIGIVDASGNVNVIYPATTGADVSITANSAISSTATTVQALVSALKSGAIYTVSDSTTSPTSGSKYLWSAYKVKSYVDGQISTLNSKIINIHTDNVSSTHNSLYVYLPVLEGYLLIESFSSSNQYMIAYFSQESTSMYVLCFTRIIDIDLTITSIFIKDNR